MNPEQLAIGFGILAAALAFSHGSASYWKARAETLEAERGSEGWIEECRFWRRVYNTEAAEAVES
ncbi:hypothetical protein [Malikia spinosa]|uniref:hypothetical protein n=1 Tax=Malikia spinosa TaxID=86180 RepID=UPI002FDA0633